MLRLPKLEKFSKMSVPALLAANALVLVVGLGSEAVGADKPATITYIVDENGNSVPVDASTPEGWKAIADAEQRGDEVVTVPVADAPPEVLAQTTTTTAPGATTTTAPGGSTTTLLPRLPVTIPDTDDLIEDADDLIEDTATTIVNTIDDAGEDIDDIVDSGTDLIDDNAGTDTGDTVDPIVDETTDTLTTTVSTTVSTIVDAVTDATPDDADETVGNLLP